jgi:Ner family transcriptional regulator
MTTNDIPKNPAHRRAWIVYQLRLRGLTLGTLAKLHNVDRTTTRKALGTPYPRMERVIADVLGLAPQQIWPERYEADGRPKTGLRSQQRSALSPKGKVARKAALRNGCAEPAAIRSRASRGAA